MASRSRATATPTRSPWRPEATNSTWLTATRIADRAASWSGRRGRSTSNTSRAAPRSATLAGTRASRSSGVPPPAAVARAMVSSFTASAASAVTPTSRLSELK